MSGVDAAAGSGQPKQQESWNYGTDTKPGHYDYKTASESAEHIRQYHPDVEVRTLFKQLQEDKGMMLKQIHQLQLENDVQAKQLDDAKNERNSLMAVRDRYKIERDIHKQILEDLHKQIINRGDHDRD